MLEPHSPLCSVLLDRLWKGFSNHQSGSAFFLAFLHVAAEQLAQNKEWRPRLTVEIEIVMKVDPYLSTLALVILISNVLSSEYGETIKSKRHKISSN